MLFLKSVSKYNVYVPDRALAVCIRVTSSNNIKIPAVDYDVSEDNSDEVV